MSVASSAIEACCANLYGHPLVELIAGQSFHPGGLASTRRLLDAAGFPSGSRILDAGCGLGGSARLAASEFGLVVDACDVSGAAIRRAKALADGAGAGVQFVEASVLGLPYRDGRFAGVLAECVLSTTTKRPALAELRRVTASGGTLLVTDVTAKEDVVAAGPLADVLCLTGAWQPGELEEIATLSGFEIVNAWDDTASISELLDRLEARIGLLTTLTRVLANTEPLAERMWGQISIADPRRIAAAFHDARRLVSDGRIGYRAVLARAVAPARQIDHVAKIAASGAG